MICFTFVERKNFGTLYSIYSMHSICKMLNEKCLKFILLFFFFAFILLFNSIEVYVQLMNWKLINSFLFYNIRIK